MKLMTVGSEEYNCMRNALVSVEKVADYINEMQRISETYTPVFQEMTQNYDDLEVSAFHFAIIWRYLSGDVASLPECECLKIVCEKNSADWTFGGQIFGTKNFANFIYS